jgi:hypothetical protein
VKADAALRRLLPEGATAPRTFPDGADFRIEIPSVEGPRVLEAVIDAAADEGIVVNRVSQGSGAMLMRESELREMSALGAEHGIEVSLFVARVVRHYRPSAQQGRRRTRRSAPRRPRPDVRRRGHRARRRMRHPQLPDSRHRPARARQRAAAHG